MVDSYIITGCLEKNPLAQRTLFNTYGPKMLGVCYRFAQNKEDAEDMLQESFIKVYQQMHTFQNKGSFEGWIRKIVVHTCINILKKHKKFAETFDIDAANYLAVKEESIASILQNKQIIECIRLLPLGYRTVLNLYAIEGYSHKEVGDMLDIGESTSRSQYTRARNMLEGILIKRKVIDTPQLKPQLAK
jgi:RNA polymerase sigma factor (sigma-70 family)